MTDPRGGGTMGTNQALGRWGEEIGAEFLRSAGWRILAQNFRARHKEIDLIARKGQIVIFVEVKARRGLDYGHPLESLRWRQRLDIGRAAEEIGRAHV